MQRLSPPSLDHHVDVDQHCMRQREHGCAAVVATAERYEATRTQGDEPRKRESSSAGSCSERTATERGARAKSPQGHPAPRCAVTRRALYETTSVTEAFCSRSAPIKRASAFCCILPLGVSRVACFHERQPALFFFGGRSANRPSEGSTQSCQTVGELVLHMLAAHSALHRFPPRPSVRVTSTVTVTTRRA